MRVYHPFHLWEDFKAGMWRPMPVDQHQNMLIHAVEFTGNHNLYGSWMLEVVTSWKYACEHNLTNTSMNRKAWVGHAAVCLATGIPEYITRQAWWRLTDHQRDLANEQAAIAIELWTENYLKNA